MVSKDHKLRVYDSGRCWRWRGPIYSESQSARTLRSAGSWQAPISRSCKCHSRGPSSGPVFGATGSQVWSSLGAAVDAPAAVDACVRRPKPVINSHGVRETISGKDHDDRPVKPALIWLDIT